MTAAQRSFLLTGIVPLLSLGACGATSATTPARATGGIDGPFQAPEDGARKDIGAPTATDAISIDSGSAADQSIGAEGAGGAEAGRPDGGRGGDAGGDLPAPAGARCPLAMVSGRYHSFARKRDGTLWCWGGNNHGQLGMGMVGGEARPSPVAFTALGGDVAEVSAGYARTCARKQDGTLWCWGENGSGQAGDGSKDDKPSPVQVTALGASVVGVAASRDHTCARKSDGTLWCWGSNGSGRLGDGTTTDRLSPVQVTALGTGVVDVRARGGVTCARKSDGTLWCWGANGMGAIGDGTTTDQSSPVQVTALGADVVEVEAGGAHVCARKGDGTLWCWGMNDVGQLGDGTTMSRSSPVQVTTLGASVVGVSAGIRHTCARKADGTLLCWGLNGMGQLGDGTSTDRSSPVQVTALGPAVVDVAAGMYFTCAAKGDSTLWCWGESRNGQLGYGGRGNGECLYNGSPTRCESSPVRVTGLCP